ncbi:MAG: cation:proton antiporter, partial [Halobacteriota archaeon]
LFTGFVLGEVASQVKLPKVTGYILAGVILNPNVCGYISADFVNTTSFVTNIALAFITFSVGGTLFYPRIKRLGKQIIFIGLFESELVFLLLFVGLLAVTPVLIEIPGGTLFTAFIPLSLLLASLGSPTDPSATLAVKHEYKAQGDVSNTIMGITAFDDALGIINYSIAASIASLLILSEALTVHSSLLHPLVTIFGAVILGALFGFLFNIISTFIKRETEGTYIVVILSLLLVCFSIATIIELDGLLSTMTMGAVVVNFNPLRKKIFRIMERYTEELIFVFFFTLSGMHLDFGVLTSSYLLIIFFVVFRAFGKFIGTFTGAHTSRSPYKVKKYVAGGLIPQGGVVIGLALLLKQKYAFDEISNIVISVIIGATIVHEFIGPVLAKIALTRAGEIKS